jgi:glycosyltransferase involved in cell wall biosynthesis
MRLVLFKVNSVISVCNEGADLFEKYTKLRPTVIPNPMTFKVTRDLELKRCDDFIFVGRLIDQKNPELLLRSFALFKNLSGLQSKLHIVGDGYLLPKLKKLSKTLDIEEDCFFHGWVDNKDIHNFLKGAKTLLSTSRSGGMEIVRLEALASGCAVVTTNTGGTHFFETNSDIGFIISEPNPDSFSLGMKQSLDKKYWKKSQISLRCSFIDKFKVDIIGPLIINSLQTKSKL